MSSAVRTDFARALFVGDAVVDTSTTTIIPDFWKASPGAGESAQMGIIPKPYEAV